MYEAVFETCHTVFRKTKTRQNLNLLAQSSSKASQLQYLILSSLMIEEDDALLAAKAMERKARLAEMIGTNVNEARQENVGAQSVGPNDAQRSSKTGDAAPLALADLDRKIAAQRPAKSSTPSIRMMKASLVTRRQEGQTETAVASSSYASESSARGNIQEELREIESNAMEKQRLPSENPRRHSAEFEPQDEQTVTAEAVNDELERQKITQEAQKDLISKTVVATAVDEDMEKRNRLCACCCLVAGVLILAAIAVGGICGSGKCRSPNDEAARIQDMTKLINSVSFYAKDATISHPPVDSEIPEEQALKYLIEYEPLKLTVVAKGAPDANWRLIQRYALLVLWFNNGPWSESKSQSGEDSATTSSGWLTRSDECAWSGVTCNNEGRLVALDLEFRELTGTIPKDFGLLVDCVEVNLSGTDLEGLIADTMSMFDPLVSLKSLVLSLTKFKGPLPTNLTHWSSLRLLDLSQNWALSGMIPDSLWKLTLLESLDISYSGLNGTIPSAIGDMTSLTKLGLSSIYYGDFPFEALGNIPNLEYLGLSQASAVHSFAALSGFSKLTQLDYSETSFVEGSIPSEVATWWPHMEHLFVRFGKLNGTIPVSLAKLSRLSTLQLGFNDFTGSLPGELFEGWCDRLEYFGVSFNNVGGTIPTEIGLCSNLEVFDIRSNNIEGTIPTTVGMLTALKIFQVSQNKLSGTIPNEVLNLNAFASFQLNNLNGVAPHCDPSYDMSDFVVRVDCDKVLCPCCDGCR